ncbi:MAG: ABC transporter ATP-binding protein [Planctomycetota bacterium]
MTEPAIKIAEVRHQYGDRVALDGVSLAVAQGETLALLGPNGSGKTTLFRLLSTLVPIQEGSIAVMGADATRDAAAVRSTLGVVFQSPSLDKKLRVEENLRCHGQLYGLAGAELRDRVEEGLRRFGVADRRRDVVETLSGGLQRRVELAKSLLHGPRVLVLDEPSTGLDPSARSDLWRALADAKAAGVTIVVTTHLLEEAERADRIAILDGGRIAAIDTPEALRASVGGDTITLRTTDAGGLAEAVNDALALGAKAIDGVVRVAAGSDAGGLAADLYGRFRDRIDAIAIGKPTLEDVFIQRTGHRFYADAEEASEQPA